MSDRKFAKAAEKIDTDKIKDQASEVAAVLSEGASIATDYTKEFAAKAREAALQAKDWGTPKVEAFVEWASPRIEQAWNETVKATAPRVEKAAEKVTPAIDTQKMRR
jgi:hypothetical protein